MTDFWYTIRSEDSQIGINTEQLLNVKKKDTVTSLG